MAPPVQAQYSLQLMDAPAITPITLAEAKSQMRIESSDDDAYITRLIAAAVTYTDARGVLGRAIITQKWAQSFHEHDTRVYLKIIPAKTLTAVKYYDTNNVLQTAITADYMLVANDDWAYVEPVKGKVWPITYDRPDAIRLEFEAGYGPATTDVPQTVRHALLLLVAHWYENREESAEKAPTSIPFGFEALLNTERTSWYG
jgi:uncharacterized phiE125 gp8 family phage protein